MNTANTNSNYTQEEQQIILKLVDATIKYGVEHDGRAMVIDVAVYPPKLRKYGASFVTLELDGKLRGCIGSLEAHQPLISDIVHNAFAAAFKDPRFSPVTRDEYAHLTKHISILSESEPMQFSSEADLIAQLRPHIDGLIFSDHARRGTFLPSVWEQLPDPKLFLQHLKMKAGFASDYWSNTLRVERYVVEVIE